ncbi:MAG: lamin tail domain-containing protein [Sedimentisphaerales bacterium]|nr:lamin tail domain-containing protein [Sedimentisphaerales bacterium]
MYKFTIALVCLVCASGALGNQWTVAINECDYDNPGTDTIEWIEIVGQTGIDLAGWRIDLINGGDPTLTPYASHYLAGVIPYDFDSEWGGQGGFYVIGSIEALGLGYVDYVPDTWPSENAIQNGDDDIIQLWAADNTLVDEWQYECASVAGPSLTGLSQSFSAYDSAGTYGDPATYNSIGRRGWCYDMPIFVFDNLPAQTNDCCDHEFNSALIGTGPRGTYAESDQTEICWSGTLSSGPDRGITPGTFNNTSYGIAGAQDSYTINIMPEPMTFLLLTVGVIAILERHRSQSHS